MNNNGINSDLLSAIIAGTISFLLYFLFKIVDALEKLRLEIQKGEKEEGSTLKMEVLLWSVSGLISGFFGALVFFGILHFVPNINNFFAYFISGMVGMNGLEFIRKLHKKGEDKIGGL